MRFVGIDIGKAKCRAAIMDPGGIILEEFTFTNNHEGIDDLASRLNMHDRVVMESTGSVWTNLYNRLDERHIPVALANPLKTKAIASAKIKSDNHNEPFGYPANSIQSPLLLKRLAYNHSGIKPHLPRIRSYEEHSLLKVRGWTPVVFPGSELFVG
jgi:hypothetical protein